MPPSSQVGYATGLLLFVPLADGIPRSWLRPGVDLALLFVIGGLPWLPGLKAIRYRDLMRSLVVPVREERLLRISAGTGFPILRHLAPYERGSPRCRCGHPMGSGQRPSAHSD